MLKEKLKLEINNNLATNSTNSYIGNNNIIFGNSNIGSSKKNSFGHLIRF